MGATVGGVSFEVFREESDVALELVGFTAAVVAVVDVEELVRNLARWITGPVFVGRTDALPGMGTAHEARVIVLHVAVLLNHLVAVEGQGEVEEGGLGSDDHVGVHGEGVGGLGGPLEFVTQTLGDLEGSCATQAEVLEGVLFDAMGFLGACQQVRGEGDGVVGGTRVEEGDGVDVREGTMEASLDDAGLILDHQEEDQTVVFVDPCGWF